MISVTKKEKIICELPVQDILKSFGIPINITKDRTSVKINIVDDILFVSYINSSVSECVHVKKKTKKWVPLRTSKKTRKK